jgi:hypothetical protein
LLLLALLLEAGNSRLLEVDRGVPQGGELGNESRALRRRLRHVLAVGGVRRIRR